MSARDKKLLNLLIVVVIIALVYLVGYQPLNKKKVALEEEVEQLETEAREIRTEYSKMEQYELDIENALVQIEEIRNELPSDLTQQRAFKLLFDIEEQSDEIHFESVTFSDVDALAFSNDKNDETTEVAVTRNMTSSLDLSYEEVKNLLDFIGNYKDRTVLSNIAMTFNEETSLLSTTFTLNMYGLLGAEREVEEVKLDKVKFGNDEPFNTPSLVEPEVIEETGLSDDVEDIFVSLRSTASDGEAQIIGLSGDPAQRSYVNGDKNSALTTIIRVFEENGTYFANYDIDGNYKVRQAFDVGNALEIKVYSTDRIDSNDKAAMNVSIINQTDIVLTVIVDGDDQDNPRFNLISSEGNVIVK